MSRMIRRSWLILLFCGAIALFPLASHALTVQDVPNPRQVNGGWVMDMADILSDRTEVQLNRRISALEAQNGAELAVVTVSETVPSPSPKAFATALFNRWGIGKRGVDNGVLFLISQGDRRVEIETGYGLAEILPDAQVKAIIDRQIIPRFKQGDFDGGAIAGTEELVSILAGEAPLSTPFDSRFGGRHIWQTWSLILGAIALVNLTGAWIVLRQRHPLPPFGESRFALWLNRHSYILLYLGSTGAIASLLLVLLARSPNPLQTFLYSSGFILLCVGVQFVRTQPQWFPLLLMLLFLSVFAIAIIPFSFPLVIGFCGAIPLAQVLAFLAKRYLRKRFSCKRCQHPLQKVAQEKLDPYLTPANQVAKKIGSIEFEGWQCSRCTTADPQLPLHVCSYILNPQRFSSCPNCKELTITKTTKKIQRPTYRSEGKSLRTEQCHCCDYEKEVELLIPKKLRVSRTGGSRSRYSGYSGYSGGSSGYSGGGSSGGGGGSSFGGGGSDGGGAGGSW